MRLTWLSTAGPEPASAGAAALLAATSCSTPHDVAELICPLGWVGRTLTDMTWDSAMPGAFHSVSM